VAVLGAMRTDFLSAFNVFVLLDTVALSMLIAFWGSM
jgi:hypothetical protein